MTDAANEPHQPEHITQDRGQRPAAPGGDEPSQLRKKLRVSRVLNLVLAGALLFVGGSYIALVTQNTNETPQTNTAAAEPVVVRAASDDPMAIGELDAPVTLLEWTDFTCPYCGVFNRETLPVLIEEYVDTGKVRLEVHDVTFIGEQAEDAAVAARAAGEQGKYFDYLLAVYELGANENKPDLSRETLFGLAEQVGVADMARFEADFTGTELRSLVQQSTALAQNIGVSSVPFFAVTPDGSIENAQALKGAQPIEQFRQYLDQMIEQAS